MYTKELSIIVLSYNQEKYIRTAIESIAKQLNNISAEIIVADDGSSDNTRRIIMEMAKQFSCICPVFNETNLGVIQNYYNALNHCNGEYIMGCGGDDFWMPYKVSRQLSYMREHPEIMLSSTETQIIDENGKVINSCHRIGNDISFGKLLTENFICASSCCIKHEILKRFINEVKPLEKEWLMEDYPIWLWIAKNYPIGCIRSVLVSYRVVSGSLSRSADIGKRIRFENSANDIRLYFSETNNKHIVNKIHKSNLTNIYFEFNDLKGFRESARKEGTVKGKIKFLMSFVPGYFKLRRFRRKCRLCKW